MAPLWTSQLEPSSPKPIMSKTPSSKHGSGPGFWPGTNIVKSMNNAFTMRPESVMATPHETTRAQKQFNAEQARKTQIERKNGFGGAATIRGLSRRAYIQLRSAPTSITISPRNSSRSDQIKRGGR